VTQKTLAATIEHYLTEWHGHGWAHAFHSLIQLGPAALPLLGEHFDEERNASLRAEIVAIADQMRTPEALALFERALRDTEAPVWKAALDALVSLPTPASIALLEHARREASEPRTPEDYGAWVAEALQQARAAAEPTQGNEQEPP
jgi:HEAT repeat protein